MAEIIIILIVLFALVFWIISRVKRKNNKTKVEEGFTSLHFAANRGNAEIVLTLLKSGAEIEARTEDGITPLHCAAGLSNAETITALLKAGANAKAIDQNANTPYDLAKLDIG